VGYKNPIDYTLTKLSERQEELKDFLSNGKLEHFHDYHRICGVIHGLDYAKDILLDLAKRLEEEDE
jgi:hypothetical protein